MKDESEVGTEDTEFSSAFAEAARANEAKLDEDPIEVQAAEAEPEPDGEEPATEQVDDDGDQGEEAEATEDPWSAATDVQRQAYQEALAEAERLRHSAHSNAGRVSALQRKVNELEGQLRTGHQAPPKPSDQPTAAQIETALQTPEQWASFSDEYPEVAAAIDLRLQSEMSRVQQQLAPLQAGIGRIQEMEAKQREREELQTLESAHPKWRETINTQDFRNWIESQPLVIQDLMESDYAEDAIALLNFFSASTRTQAQPNGGAQAQPERVSSIQASRQRRLEQSAETPTRRSAARPLGEDDFSSAFRAAAAKKARGAY